MRKTTLILMLIAMTIQINGQDCYTNSTDHYVKYDFSSLWINNTFQGTIGDKNQRIEIRFLTIKKDSDHKYSVKGKSKVNSNICDFKGIITIYKIDIVNSDCEGPDYSFGILTAKYNFKEDSTQNHVGVFTGVLKTMFDKNSNGFELFSGWYSDEGVSNFTGEWKGYDKPNAKYCSWGLQIPPTKRDDLFKHNGNEFYMFNSEYLDKGWRSYVLANLGVFITIPKEFYTDKPGYADDFMDDFSKEEIEKNRKIENDEWWWKYSRVLQKNISDFLPKGYVICEEIYGDLNSDELEDCILLIKETDKNSIVKDEYRGALDRNRRGIIVLFNTNNKYELSVENYNCFSSENEDGGVYYSPGLSIEIKKGNLYIHYSHGRYGYGKYTFRFQNSDFELIGYDSGDNSGPVINKETSINFSTKKKLIKENTNINAQGGDEVFKETWEKVDINRLIKLSEIMDFDELDVN